MHGSEERPVQPPSPLRDQLRNLVWHIRHRVRALHVVQNPRPAALAHKLPAEDTILRKVHVRREDVRARAVHLLAKEILLQRAFAELVVLQRDVAVRGEGAGQDRDVPKERLEGLVEDVRDLVLEVLGGDWG